MFIGNCEKSMNYITVLQIVRTACYYALELILFKRSPFVNSDVSAVFAGPIWGFTGSPCNFIWMIFLRRPESWAHPRCCRTFWPHKACVNPTDLLGVGGPLWPLQVLLSGGTIACVVLVFLLQLRRYSTRNSKLPRLFSWHQFRNLGDTKIHFTF